VSFKYHHYPLAFPLGWIILWEKFQLFFHISPKHTSSVCIHILVLSFVYLLSPCLSTLLLVPQWLSAFFIFYHFYGIVCPCHLHNTVPLNFINLLWYFYFQVMANIQCLILPELGVSFYCRGVFSFIACEHTHPPAHVYVCTSPCPCFCCNVKSGSQNKRTNSVALVREQTLPTERSLLVSEVGANFFLQIEGFAWSAQRIPTAIFSVFHTGATTFSFK
jgi:hypothetical protein